METSNRKSDSPKWSYKESEFIVSEDTAKWVRLIKKLHELSGCIYSLTDSDGKRDEEKYYPLFSALEDLLVEDMGKSVLTNLMWTDFPKNMI